MGGVPLPWKATIFVLWRLVLAGFLSSGLAGCLAESSPDLLQVERVGPQVVERGTAVEVLANGLPEGRAGTMTWVGTVSTPGRSPRSVEASFPVFAESSAHVRLRAADAFVDEFTDGAEHVTFRGTVELSFAPVRAGAPPLRGRSSHVLVDVFSSGEGGVPDRVISAEKQARDFAGHLGIELADGMVIQQVQANSRAARAGLQVGDRLHELDGVRLSKLRDLRPVPRARYSTLQVSRPGHRGRAEVPVARPTFQVIDLSVAERAVAMVLGVVLSLLLAARPPRWFLWLARKRSDGSSALGWGDSSVLSRVLAYAMIGLVAVGLWALLGGRLASPDYVLSKVDLPFILSLALLPLFLAAFFTGGARTKKRGGAFSFTAAILGAISCGISLLPVLAGVALAAAHVGSLHTTDYVREQTAAPSGWFLLLSPLSLVLGLGYLMALVPLSGRRPPLAGTGHDRAAPFFFARSLEWGGHVLLAGLWVVLFAGGTAGVPVDSPLGAAILALKLLIVLGTVAWLRGASGYVRRGEIWGAWGGVVVGGSLVSAALAFVVHWWIVDGDRLQAMSVAAFYMALVGVLAGIATLRTSRLRQGRLTDPWI